MIENKTQSLSIWRIEQLLMTLIELIKQIPDTKDNLGILTQKELLSYLNIAPNTLKEWERKGLKRLEPPIERTRTVFYKASDVLEFLTN